MSDDATAPITVVAVDATEYLPEVYVMQNGKTLVKTVVKSAAKPKPVASPVGTKVTTAGPVIEDAAGNTYALNAVPGQILLNTKIVTSSAKVIELEMTATGVQQINSGGEIWTVANTNVPGAYVGQVVSPTPAPTPVPVPVPTPTPVPTGGTGNAPSGAMGGYTPNANLPATVIPAKYQNKTPLLHINDFRGFETTSVGDATHWANSMPPGENRSLNAGTEVEFYCDPTNGGYNPFSVDANNSLVITATMTGGDSYNSGCITSQTCFNFQYGFVSFKCKLPVGIGTWPAGWALPTSLQYNAELDVFEGWQDEQANVHQTVHGNLNGQWESSGANGPANNLNDYNDYQVDWQADFCQFYVNGVPTSKPQTPQSMQEQMYLLLNLAIGGSGTWVTNNSQGQSQQLPPGDNYQMTIAEILVIQ